MGGTSPRPLSGWKRRLSGLERAELKRRRRRPLGAIRRMRRGGVHSGFRKAARTPYQVLPGATLAGEKGREGLKKDVENAMLLSYVTFLRSFLRWQVLGLAEAIGRAAGRT